MTRTRAMTVAVTVTRTNRIELNGSIPSLTFHALAPCHEDGGRVGSDSNSDSASK